MLTTPIVTNYASSPSAGILDPYFQLAEQYGFANYMFQTNEGPSFLAHQFLFSGTSAPEGYSTSDTNYQLFAAENPTPGQLSGCASAGPSTGNPGTLVEDISSVTGGEGYDYQPPYYYDLVEAAYGYPCYDHASMANLLDNGGITWKYYTNYPPSANTIWTAPNAFYKICGYHPGQDGDQGACVNNTANNDWDKVDYQTYGDILNDINNTDCTALKNVSWVIPDGHWSDHPGGLANGFGDGGPSWAAAIVNAVGDSTCGYWNNTVILVVWDDWGGWYDHIQPYTTGGYIGGSNHNGQSYVYGLRVPLLVVSGYTKTSTDGGDGYTGYISGTSTQGGENDGQYVHDFGSILGFIEHVFGLDTATGFCGIAGSDSDYPEGCNYPYADYFAPDGPHDTECGVTLCPYPLSDFFDFTDSVNAFHTIEGAKYAPDCFTDPSRDTCFGTDFEPASPDMDDVHPQN
jgi:hypothetical protein